MLRWSRNGPIYLAVAREIRRPCCIGRGPRRQAPVEHSTPGRLHLDDLNRASMMPPLALGAQRSPRCRPAQGSNWQVRTFGPSATGCDITDAASIERLRRRMTPSHRSVPRPGHADGGARAVGVHDEGGVVAAVDQPPYGVRAEGVGGGRCRTWRRRRCAPGSPRRASSGRAVSRSRCATAARPGRACGR